MIKRGSFFLQSWVSNRRELLQIQLQKSEVATRSVLQERCVLRNFAKFTGKDLRQSLFFHTVVGLRSSKNFLRTTVLVTRFLQNTGRLLLKNNYQILKNLFQIFLIYEFSFRKIAESFIDSLLFVYVEKQYRSSRSEVFCLKDILKNLYKIHGKTPVPEPLFK